jgi:hypothetical protein
MAHAKHEHDRDLPGDDLKSHPVVSHPKAVSGLALKTLHVARPALGVANDSGKHASRVATVQGLEVFPRLFRIVYGERAPRHSGFDAEFGAELCVRDCPPRDEVLARLGHSHALRFRFGFIVDGRQAQRC